MILEKMVIQFRFHAPPHRHHQDNYFIIACSKYQNNLIAVKCFLNAVECCSLFQHPYLLNQGLFFLHVSPSYSIINHTVTGWSITNRKIFCFNRKTSHWQDINPVHIYPDISASCKTIYPCFAVHLLVLFSGIKNRMK